MFELPDAKRVRRDELYDSLSEGEAGSAGEAEDDAMRARLNAQLSSLFAIDFVEPTSKTEAQQGLQGDASQTADLPDDQEEEFEFRLFSTAKAGPQKVVIEHDEAGALQNQEGSFVVPERPASFYLASEATPEQKASFSLAAVTAEDIVASSKKRAWGLEVPWRVRKITVTRSKLRTLSTGGTDSTVTLPVEGDEHLMKRKRPGKKRRILLRVTAQAKKQHDEAAEKTKVSKEEHLKEKKKRLNREKKLKRRQKDKEKKLAAQAAGDQTPDSNAGGQQDGSASEAESASA